MEPYLCLNISHLYNSTIFHLDNPSSEAANNEEDRIMGNLFVPSSIKGFEENVLIVDSIPYLNPLANKLDTYDNIACEGQVHEGINKRCNEIYMLGLAEYGIFEDTIGLQLSNGERLDVSFMLNDWRKGISNWEFGKRNECSIALSGHDTIGEPRYVYYCAAAIGSPDIAIQDILLPYNPNVHLFAITLRLTP